ncbi:Receptor protein-tyrosine kinase [Fasciolopsis buskii]|uniref:Receptor protein-tyrosine kinase n=1 Tax=Fasciolopsis buskii TaxID=27845 RepID=A0A8E0RSS1_9TREM|nr:Receptor protein-tyrosine kinase [Fasciolopsis buski]
MHHRLSSSQVSNSTMRWLELVLSRIDKLHATCCRPVWKSQAKGDQTGRVLLSLGMCCRMHWTTVDRLQCKIDAPSFLGQLTFDLIDNTSFGNCSSTSSFLNLANYLRDGDNCVSQCGRPGTFPQNGRCVSCSETQCPKACSFREVETVKGIDYLRRTSVRAMRNCTTFHGDIKLSRQSFVGDPFHNMTRADEGVRWSDLMEGLSGLREVTGILYISAGSDAPWLTNLTFLSKLEVIGGGRSVSLFQFCLAVSVSLGFEKMGLFFLNVVL